MYEIELSILCYHFMDLLQNEHLRNKLKSKASPNCICYFKHQSLAAVQMLTEDFATSNLPTQDTKGIRLCRGIQ